MSTIGQNNSTNQEEFYESLKEKLDQTHNFPEDYLFKFIVTNDKSKLTEIYRVFDGIKFTMTNRESKNGKYTSANISAFVLDGTQVCKIYREVGQIEGVIML